MTNDNPKSFLWLRKFIRIMRPGWRCQKVCERSLKHLRIEPIDLMLLQRVRSDEFREILPDLVLMRTVTCRSAA